MPMLNKKNYLLTYLLTYSVGIWGSVPMWETSTERL